MSEIEKFTVPMPQEDADNLRLEASGISPTEARLVQSLATLISQTINSAYGRFIPRETVEANHEIGKRVVVMDDLTVFGKVWEPNYSESTTPENLTGDSHQFGGIITILNPEVERGRCCPHCEVQDSDAVGSDFASEERYKGRYYTTFLAHEEVHQYQDWSLPIEVKEMGAYYYTAEIARRLGHKPLGDNLAGMRYDAYNALINKYGDDVHRVFFGSAHDPISKLKKPFILREAQKQKNTLFPNNQDL